RAVFTSQQPARVEVAVKGGAGLQQRENSDPAAASAKLRWRRTVQSGAQPHAAVAQRPRARVMQLPALQREQSAARRRLRSRDGGRPSDAVHSGSAPMCSAPCAVAAATSQWETVSTPEQQRESSSRLQTRSGSPSGGSIA
ncbi:hypothetical protein Dimus_028869, partial [Dionaea muscipula]